MGNIFCSQKLYRKFPKTVLRITNNCKIDKNKKIYVPIVTYLSTKNTCTVTPKKKTAIFLKKTQICATNLM
jgi:hypothetical protein